MVKPNKSPSSANANGTQFKELDPVRIYLKDVGKTPLLNHAKEIELSKTIESSKQTIMDTLFAIPMTVRTIDIWIQEILNGERPADEIFDVELQADGTLSQELVDKLTEVRTMLSLIHI